MTDKDLLGVRNQTAVLYSKLSVRDAQYEIALEGLRTITESNDPMGIAEQTIKAMMDCLTK